MSKNRFYTIMIVPEKGASVRRFVLPSWVARGTVVALLLLTILGIIMTTNYGFVMSQIGENKELKVEIRKLRLESQVLKEKLTGLETSVDRMKSFATRLKVITNIEDQAKLLERINAPGTKIPDANSNIAFGKAKPFSAQPEGDSPSDSAAAPETDWEAAYQELDIETRVERVSSDANLVEQMLQDQNELLSDKRAFLAALPTRKPVPGRYNSGFGVRKSPITGSLKIHEGIDIGNVPGSQIIAPSDATVTFAEIKPGYGRTLVLDHGYGVTTWYGHTQKILVQRGQRVRRGDSIALLGNSGQSTGPHLHYEVRIHGIPVDPLSYILEN